MTNNTMKKERKILVRVNFDLHIIEYCIHIPILEQSKHISEG